METRKKFYITTAIDYVNSVPHIGTAYEKIGADVLARFKRMDGYEVFFLMGNDEHSINVKKEAESLNLDPQQYCDMMAPKFQETWQNLEISYDDFIRTTEPRHVSGVETLFKKIADKGDIYKGTYRGLYCESCEAFLTDKDLVDGLCPNHKKPPRQIEEENYFFALSRYGDRLLEHIRAKPSFIMPEIRRNEVIRMIEGGLEDISVSRSTFDWGIPLPISPDHVIYVWFDALINYLTGIGYGSDSESFNKWWPADVHIIGKDITRFHCIIWPAMLMSGGVPLPETVFGHGFVYQKGEKMSKSLGNIIRPLDIVNVYGPSPLRYFLLRESSFGKDSDFTWEQFIDRYNGDLANDLGNLLQRVLNMVEKYQDGIIRKTGIPCNQDLANLAKLLVPNMRNYLNVEKSDVDFHRALGDLWYFIGEVNRFVDKSAPWSLKKSGDEEQLASVLYDCVESLRFISVIIKPFMPSAGVSIWTQLGLNNYKNFAEVAFKDIDEWGQFPDGVKIQKGASLFPRIERESGQQKQAEIKTTISPSSRKEIKKMSHITFKDFQKLDLRIAKIMGAERVEGTDKLLKLQIDIGTEKRQIVAGIADQYPPETLVDKLIVLVVNLEPATIRGVESNGMLLAADIDGKPILLKPDSDVPPGTIIH